MEGKGARKAVEVVTIRQLVLLLLPLVSFGLWIQLTTRFVDIINSSVTKTKKNDETKSNDRSAAFINCFAAIFSFFFLIHF